MFEKKLPFFLEKNYLSFIGMSLRVVIDVAYCLSCTLHHWLRIAYHAQLHTWSPRSVGGRSDGLVSLLEHCSDAISRMPARRVVPIHIYNYSHIRTYMHMNNCKPAASYIYPLVLVEYLILYEKVYLTYYVVP